MIELIIGTLAAMALVFLMSLAYFLVFGCDDE